jgi:beta-N-acetylhexosaminidase
MLLRFKKKLFFNSKTQVFLSSVFFNNDLKKALLQVLYGTLFFFGMPFLFAQEMDPLLTNDSSQQEAWVQQQLKSMTLNEKIGQLFMVQAYSNKGAVHVKSLLKKIKKHKVGGLIFMQGTPENQVRLNNRYQKESKIPLLIGFDGEWGLDMRLKKTFRYPWNMTLGAIQNEHLINQFGERLGLHCKRMGIHVNFAPVVDINTNPKNPIIGNRSFGEDKFNVSRKAAAFVKGMQAQRVLANAKHFPGHGDTAADSHKTLPQVSFDKTRLQDVELYPYTQVFEAGLGSVMVAHLSVPALEPNASLPTSLSHKVVSELLQEQMGFRGLVFTDALNMKGASNYAKPGAIDLAALLAGNDVLLIPENVGAAVKVIKKALRKKQLTLERLEHSVTKILKAKYWAGLHAYKPVSLENLESDLNTVADSLLHHKLVENSLTLLQNKEGIFPIKALEKSKIAYVKLGTSPHSKFVSMLQNYTDVEEVTEKNTTALLKKLAAYDRVLIGYHASNETPWKSYDLNSEEHVLLQQIAEQNKVVLTVFASPYSLLTIPSFESVEGVLLAYQNSSTAQEVAAQMVFGALEAKGKLPVSIGKKFPVGTGLSSVNLMRLSYGFPEAVGMSSLKLLKIDSLAREMIAQKMAPGAQVLIARHGKVVYHKSFGYHTYKQKQPVSTSDLYDLASLTKILGGLPLIMKSEEMGLFDLDTDLGTLLPEFKNSNKDTLTVKEMLSHTARLPAWIPFFRHTIDSVSKQPLKEYYQASKTSNYSIEVAKEFYLRTDYRDSLYQQIKEVPQRADSGYKYSGLPFYLFNKYLETHFSMGMDSLAALLFYKPLGAKKLMYNPLRKFPAAQIIPSENDAYYRHQTLVGHVHDMGAAMMGGVSGNAGLFSNANDIAKFMQMYLQDGLYGGHRYLQAHTLKKFNKRYFQEAAVRRGLGFDKPQLDPAVKATCGCVSDNSFGHSGFTGTYAWADPDSGLLYVFLSNRTYPTMDNNKLGDEDIRTKIQGLAVDAIQE